MENIKLINGPVGKFQIIIVWLILHSLSRVKPVGSLVLEGVAIGIVTTTNIAKVQFSTLYPQVIFGKFMYARPVIYL